MTDVETIHACRKYALGLLHTIDHYPYHNIHHTLAVYERVGYLCRVEGISEMVTTDLLIAALFHDVGFVSEYSENESIGAAMACEYLATLGYDPDRIADVERYIMATCPGMLTQDIGEEIMQDADLDNFWREDAFENTKAIYREMRELGHVRMTWQQWLRGTLAFMIAYQYHTKTSQNERDAVKEENITHLLEVMRTEEQMAVPVGA